MEEIIWCNNCNRHTLHKYDEDDQAWYCTECTYDDEDDLIDRVIKHRKKQNGIDASWLTFKVKYLPDKIGTVILEDKTHIVLQFDNGSKLCTPKIGLENKIMP